MNEIDTKQHEMYMTNVSPNARGPTATYIAPACVGLALDPWIFVLGLWRFRLGPRGFSDTNMSVSATQKSRVGRITPTQGPNVRGFVL